jgi:hypothetical protein
MQNCEKRRSKLVIERERELMLRKKWEWRKTGAVCHNSQRESGSSAKHCFSKEVILD